MQLVSNFVHTEDQKNELKQANIQSFNKFIRNRQIGSDFHLVISHNVLTVRDSKIPLDIIANSLGKGGFIILREEPNININNNDLQQVGLALISKQRIDKKEYILLKKNEPPPVSEVIYITEKNFSWLEDLKSAIRRVTGNGKELLVVGQHEPDLGISKQSISFKYEPFIIMKCLTTQVWWE